MVTNYEILNGQIVVPLGTYENGETTSLFVLAEWLSSTAKTGELPLSCPALQEACSHGNLRKSPMKA